MKLVLAMVDGVDVFGGFDGIEATLAARPDPVSLSTLGGDFNGDDPFTAGSGGELFLDGSACVDAGDDSAADSATTGYPAFGLDWRDMTTLSGGALGCHAGGRGAALRAVAGAVRARCRGP